MNEKTIAQIALELHEPENRVRYMIAKHNIVPSRTIGNCRVYDSSAQSIIKEAVYNIRIQRG